MADLAFHAAMALSIGAFLVYGLLCLYAGHMAAEFERYGLARLRRTVGALEVLGAVGLAVGYALPVVRIAAAAGLVVLMALGVATRLRVRDPLLQAVPALVLLAANLYVCAWTLTRAADG